MRSALATCLILFPIAIAGCKSSAPSDKAPKLNLQTARPPSEPKPSAQSKSPKPTDKPENPGRHALVRVESAGGKVAWVNYSLKFVVLDFSLKQVPELQSHMFIYRAGRKVGEVRITGPVRDSNIAADLVAGDAEVGDEVRTE